jgi:hypothetical protein
MYSSCICGVICMSEHVWCHGPSCHLNHTLDRVRGSKGSKVLRTRKYNLIQNILICILIFVVMVVTMTLQINTFNKSLRLHQDNEPLETPIENPERTKHTNNWGYTYYNTKIREREV